MVEAIIGGFFIFFIINLIITILFLLSQNAFAKSMITSNPMNNTNGVWIWTQLIPLWNLVAIPVTLLKLNTQFQAFIAEKNLSYTDIKMYSNLWGWIWYGGMIASWFLPILWIIALVGLIGFWVHISNVKNSIFMLNAAPVTVSAETQE